MIRTKILFLLPFVALLSGCVTFYPASKTLISEDKFDFDLAKKEWTAFSKKKPSITKNESKDIRAFNKRVQEANSLIRSYKGVLQNRDPRAAYSEWPYAAMVRVAMLHESIANHADKLAATYPNKSANWRSLRNKAYKKSLRQYLTASFMGHYFQNKLPSDATHQEDKNTWIRKARAGSQRVAKKLNFTPIRYNNTVLNLFKRASPSIKVDKELRPHQLTYIKKYPLQ